MRIRTAVMTGLTGLMLQMGLGDAFAQPVYRYRDGTVVRRYSSDSRWEAAQLVRQAYLDVLRREPDRSGLRQYTNAILNEGWSLTDVRRSLANSDEYAQRFGRSSRWGRTSYRYRY